MAYCTKCGHELVDTEFPHEGFEHETGKVVHRTICVNQNCEYGRASLCVAKYGRHTYSFWSERCKRCGYLPPDIP